MSNRRPRSRRRPHRSRRGVIGTSSLRRSFGPRRLPSSPIQRLVAAASPTNRFRPVGTPSRCRQPFDASFFRTPPVYFSGASVYCYNADPPIPRADPPIPQADLSIPQADPPTIDCSCLRHIDLPIVQANLSIHSTDLSATHKNLPT